MTEIYELCEGADLRLCIMLTHYRRPLDFNKKRKEEAIKILKKWFIACEPCMGPHFCPVEILECYCDDMNTAKAVAIMHGYCKDRKGKELFRTMVFLGFFGNPRNIHEVKTLPDAPVSNFGADVAVCLGVV